MAVDRYGPVALSKWDYRFLDLAKHTSTWSKDVTKLGAVAVIDQRVVATGYNGFPRGVQDLETRYNDRETKLKYVVHAEMNCIFNAARHGASLIGATLYVDGIAVCSECAKGVIQSGISRVVMRYKPMKSMWAASFELTKELFAEAGVAYVCEETTETPSSGNEPVEQTDTGTKAEPIIREARGVGKRHGSVSAILRELSDGQRHVLDEESGIQTDWRYNV